MSFNPLLSTISNLGQNAIDSHHIDHFHQNKLDKIIKKDVQPTEEKEETTN